MAIQQIDLTAPCPCGSGKNFGDCCEPFITGRAQAPTAESLMRSRYSAYVVGNFGYLRTTSGGSARRSFDEKTAREWANEADWRGLQILKSQESGQSAEVEFVVTYAAGKKVLEHHEVSKFRREADGRWYFLDGDSHTHEEGGHKHAHSTTPVQRDAPKIGRNDPCTCGSGKKYKKCCGITA